MYINTVCVCVCLCVYIYICIYIYINICMYVHMFRCVWDKKKTHGNIHANKQTNIDTQIHTWGQHTGEVHHESEVTLRDKTNTHIHMHTWTDTYLRAARRWGASSVRSRLDRKKTHTWKNIHTYRNTHIYRYILEGSTQKRSVMCQKVLGEIKQTHENIPIYIHTYTDTYLRAARRRGASSVRSRLER